MPAGRPPLPEPDEAHLWLYPLAGPPDEIVRLAALLSGEEQVRAGRFRFERDRHRFVVARGRLREVLGAYLACSPARVTFGYGARGKPRLAGAAVGTGLAFSLSHTGDHALVGVTRGRQIGVDLEEIRPDVLGEAEASLLLSEPERHAIARLPPADRVRAFFTAWVQKEAYAKARGDGLALDLQAIDLTACEGWEVRALEIGGEFAAALATRGPVTELRWFGQAAR